MKLTTVALLSCTFALAGGAAFGQEASATPKSTPWETSASAGLTLTRGNSKTLLFTASLLAAKKWDHNELQLGADGVYGENNSVRNAQSARAFGQFNRLFSDRAFGYLRVEGLHDDIADVDYRLTVSPGGGYYYIKTTNTTLRAEVGPGFIYERNGTGTHSYMSLRVGERFEHKFNERVRVWETLEFLPQVDRFSNYLINAEVGVETMMSKKLSLLTYLQDTYDNEPSTGRQKNDIKLVSAIKYKF